MTTTTYTVYNPNSGTELGRGLTAVTAAQEVLGHDSHGYELRREDNTWCLYITRGSRASYGGHGGFVPAQAGSNPIYSHAATEAEAWEEIALKVIDASRNPDWGRVDAMTDAEYDTVLAGE